MNCRFQKNYATPLRVIAFLTLLTFSLTSGAQAQLPVSSINNGSGQSTSTPGIGDRIIIPEELGNIQTQFKAAGDVPFIILIQDAHAIPDAQVSIQKIIDYLQDKYKN